MGWDRIYILLLENNLFEAELGLWGLPDCDPREISYWRCLQRNSYVTSTEVRCWLNRKQNSLRFPVYFYVKHFSKFPLDVIKKFDKKASYKITRKATNGV